MELLARPPGVRLTEADLPVCALLNLVQGQRWSFAYGKAPPLHSDFISQVG